MALTMWGQVIIQATSPAESPVQVGTLWIDTSGTATLKVCTSISPYTFAAITGAVAAHEHTAADVGALTADEHLTFSDYTGTTTPATPTAGHARLYAKTSNGHTAMHHMDEDGTEFQVLRDQTMLVRNTSGASLAKGVLVDIYGATGSIANVQKASASAATTHSEGVMAETVANNGFGVMYTLGILTGVDTSAWTEGDQLYLSDTAGLFTTTPGTYTQGVGIVIRSHATLGEIFFYPDTMERLHATKHKSGGIDAIKLDELAAPTDVTTLNSSTSAHGLLKKLSNVSTEFMNGQGNWATPAGGGSVLETQVFS